MSTLYKRIEDLCRTKDVNISQMCASAGITRGAMTDFKMGRTKTLSASTLTKIADYFDVTVDYLLTGMENDQTVSTMNLYGLDPVKDAGYFSIMAEAKQDGISQEDLAVVLDFFKRARREDEENLKKKDK